MSNDDAPEGAKYRFVPYARQGYRPSDGFRKEGPDVPAQPTFGVTVTPKAKRREEDREGGTTWDTDPTERKVSLSLYGPGDVQSVDTEQIVRVEPEPDTAEFPASYFPFIEFDRPDLPWLFSPERADGKGRTRPWLTLIVVTDDDTVDVTVGGRRPAPVLTFQEGADLDRELPDLTESWAWAHVQAHGSPQGESQADWETWLPEELQRTSNITVSRIISPRNLQPETDYVACLVPTFEAGRRAGLGEDPYDGSSQSTGSESSTNSESSTDSESSNGNGRGNAGKISLAWDKSSLPEPPFELPLYHYWRFTAGEEGTFESLVRKLEPVELGESVGKKAVDVGDPGPDRLVPDDNPPTTDVAGALYSVPAKESMTTFGKQGDLRDLLNKPETLGSLETSSEDAKFPIVGPPLYGQWHAGLLGIPAEGAADPDEYDPEWFRQLNVNLRNRVAASVGARVVKEHQNQLMDAAWEVVGEVREANEFTRAHQGVEAIGEAVENWEDGIGDVAVEEPGSRFDDVWAVRREFDRLRELGAVDVDDLGTGPGGISPGGGAVDDVAPDRGTTQPGARDVESTAAGESVQPTDTTQPGETVQPSETTQPAGGLSSTYLGATRMGDVVETRRMRSPDGGTALATGPGPDDPSTKAAVYTQYLETFLAQPETSLQYQRLVRLDGPVSRRAGIDRTAYGRTLRRASQRAASEVGTVADGALGGTPGPLPEPDGTDAESTDEATGGSDDALGRNMFLDPEAVASMGESESTSDSGGGGATGDAAPPESAPAGPGTDVGTLEADRLAMPATRSLPRTRTLETREASRAALDARVAGARLDYRPAGDARPEPPEREAGERSVRGLAESVRRHCGAAEGRIRAARRSLSTGEPATATVLEAYEAAQPIAYALDPLDRTLSKVVADPSVTVAEQLTESYKDDRMVALRAAYADLLAALTDAHGTLAGPSDDETGGAVGPDGEGAGSGDSSGTGGENGDAESGADPTASLAEADEGIDRIRSILSELVALLSPASTSATVPGTLEPDLSGSTVTALDPRRESTYAPDLAAVDTQLASRSGEGRYRRTLLTQRVSFMSGEFVESEDPVERVMVAPEFPTPMWRPLKELDEEFLLPGADSVDPNSVGLVVQNREFIESYMVGLSHEMGRELLWRRYPTDRRGTYFRRFWNRGKGPAWSPGSEFRVNEDVPSKDIERIHEWDESKLRCNAPGGTDLNKVVLLVRGQLFKRYPNTVVYAAKAKTVRKEGRTAVEPMTPERFVRATDPDPADIKFPTFRGNIGSDLTFLGFDLTHEDVHANQEEIREVVEEGKVPETGQNLGWYFVFEERPGETRFGLDVGDEAWAGSRPYGVVDKSGKPRYARKNGSKRNVKADEPVGWDDLSWYHLVDDPGKLDSLSYVPVEEGPPGKGSWRVEEGKGDFAQYMEAAEGFEPTDEATWKRNSAHMARITWQKPVRVSFHAHELLPDDVSPPSDTDYCG